MPSRECGMPMGQMFPRVLTEVEVRGTVFDARYNREISGLFMIVIHYSTIGGVVVRLTHSRLVFTFTAAGFWKRPWLSQSSPPCGINDRASSRVLVRQHLRQPHTTLWLDYGRLLERRSIAPNDCSASNINQIRYWFLREEQFVYICGRKASEADS